MISPELESWLGDHADHMTMDEINLFAKLAGGETKPKALEAIRLYVMGDLNLQREARELQQLDEQAREQRDLVYAGIRCSVTHGGMAEYWTAQVTGVSRPTIRKIVGK